MSLLPSVSSVVRTSCPMSVVGRVVFWMWDELSSEWGELSSECGASCPGASFLWGELSWGELSLGRIVRNPNPWKRVVSILSPFSMVLMATEDVTRKFRRRILEN